MAISIYPFTPNISMHNYFPYCSPCISKKADKENLCNSQELLQLVIIFSILITFIFDLGITE